MMPTHIFIIIIIIIICCPSM